MLSDQAPPVSDYEDSPGFGHGSPPLLDNILPTARNRVWIKPYRSTLKSMSLRAASLAPGEAPSYRQIPRYFGK